MITMQRIGDSVRYRWRKMVRRYPPRAQQDYATHIPILLGLGRILKVRRVLEFGCGVYSTLTFLNRSAFPDLQAMNSFEDDPAWLERVAEMAGRDGRLNLHLCPEPLDRVLPGLPLSDYDLVLVDNSNSIAGREATIRALARIADKLPPVVIHDFEVERYRRAARGFLHRFECSSFCPSTGTAWSDGLLTKQILRRLMRVIREHRGTISPTDVSAWTIILDRVYGRINPAESVVDANIL